MKIGIVSVQGAFIEHEKMLASLGAECVELRKKEDIERNEISAIVLPGGESTVQGKLLRELGMFGPIKRLIESGVPVLATCAGMILLAQHISGDGTVHFGTLPVTVRRNAYGRQLGSFVRKGNVSGIGEFEMAFIRAPFVEETESRDVDVLSEVDGRIVAVRFKNQLALAFHPEIGEDTRIHELFLAMIEQSARRKAG